MQGAGCNFYPGARSHHQPHPSIGSTGSTLVVGAGLLGATECLAGDVDARPALLVVLVLNEGGRSRVVRELVVNRRRPD